VIETQESRVLLKNIKENTNLQFSIPYAGQAARIVCTSLTTPLPHRYTKVQAIGICLRYWTRNEPETNYISHFSKTVDTTLPVQVRVQDVFREEA
jgi:hypothetical protein